jgi:hypothetical protein
MGKYFIKTSEKQIIGTPDKDKQQIIGIPSKEQIRAIPNISNPTIWEGGIQLHKAKRAGTHYDLRLGDPSSSYAHSWALRSLPKPTEKVLAVQQPTHSLNYMDFKGEIPEGYGAGKVSLHFRDKVEILEAGSSKILFNIYKGNETHKYALLHREGNNWILYNYTTTEKSKIIPTKKPSYKEMGIDDVDINNNKQVLAPKMDGAHNIFVLRPNKRIETYSYRPSKKTIKLKNDTETKTTISRINHTFKTNLYKERSPKVLGTTVIRGELYLPGQVSSNVGSILNSNVLKARENPNVHKMQNVIFDVVMYKGKNVEDLPYREKLSILKDINKKIPALKIPKLAKTKESKKNLIESIKSKSHPETDEGVVIYDLEKAIPIKAKVRHDYDVFIKDVFEGKGKYKGKAAGGFIGSRTPQGEANVRVGSGLNDEIRKDIYKNPDKYLGQWIKVYAQSEYPSGKLRMPVFKEFRDYEKWTNKPKEK